MKVLLDRQVPHRLRAHFRSEDESIRPDFLDGKDLRISDYSLSVIVLSRGKNRPADLLELMPKVGQVLETAKAGYVYYVSYLKAVRKLYGGCKQVGTIVGFRFFNPKTYPDNVCCHIPSNRMEYWGTKG